VIATPGATSSHKDGNTTFVIKEEDKEEEE
jgi:hypothetical protein